MNRRTRAVFSLIFLLLTGSSIFVRANVPEGPWVNLHAVWAPAWAGIIVAVGFLSWLTYRERVYESTTVFLGGLIVALIVSFTHVWGLPFGMRDVWAHYDYIQHQKLSLAENSYPAFHALILLLAELTGISDRDMLRISSIFGSLLAFALLALVTRRVNVQPRVRQLGLLAAIPACFIAFTPRSFLFAFPLTLIILWTVFGGRSLRMRALSVFIPIITLPLHPQVALYSLFILVGAFLVQETSRRVSIEELSINVTTLQIACIGIGLLSYLILLIGFADRFVSVLAGAFIETGGGTAGADTGDSYLTLLLENPSEILEAVARLGFILALGGLLALGLVDDLRDRLWRTTTWATNVTAGTIGGFFVFVDVALSSSLTNVTRLFELLPLLLAPSAIVGLRRRQWTAIVLTIFVFTTGIIVTVPTELTGNIQLSATDQQVEGVEWIGEHNQGQPIEGARMTFWVAQGLFGMENIYSWSPSDEFRNPQVTAGDGYSWETDPPPGRLVVINQQELGYAYHEANQTGNESHLQELESYREETSQIYSNGGTTIVVRTD